LEARYSGEANAADEEEEETDMPGPAYNELGEYIFNQNPYGTSWQPKSPPVDFDHDQGVEKDGLVKHFSTDPPHPVTHANVYVSGGTPDAVQDLVMKGLFWDFKGTAYRVSKALLVPYTYTDPDTKKTVQDVLLIGYGGAAGM
jgi:hypothetical protein